MRRMVLLLCLLASLAAPLTAAPAPLARRDRVRESPAQVRERRLAERKAKLDAMGVRWSIDVRDGRGWVRFHYVRPRDGGGVSGNFLEDDLYSALGLIIAHVERFDKGLFP